MLQRLPCSFKVGASSALLRLILPEPLESKCWGLRYHQGSLCCLLLQPIPCNWTTTEFMALGITTSLHVREALHITVTREAPPTTLLYRYLENQGCQVSIH